jgi:NAD(P)-dependent dehydrogenase (short-subunit alcohol dehydrogenase family)
MSLFLSILFIIATLVVTIKLYLYATNVYCDENIDMSGKVVIITGCSSGIGKYTAKILAKNNAHVIMAVRSKERGQKAYNEIKAQYPYSRLTLLLVDLSNLESVNQFVHQFEELNLPLHVLINNAGIASFAEKDQMPATLEPMFVTNHLGHYLLTKKLLPHLIKSNTKDDPGRIVIVSSNAHYFVKEWQLSAENVERFAKVPTLKTSKIFYFSILNQYGFTKLCNLYHAQHLNSILKENGIRNVTVNALHPGAIKTELERESANLPFYHRIYAVPIVFIIRSLFFRSVRAGAQTSIYAASAPEMRHVSGKYLSRLKIAKTSKLAQDKRVQQAVIDLSEKLIEPYL